MSKRQLLFNQAIVWVQSIKGQASLMSVVTHPTGSYTRPPSPLDRATASLRVGRCSPTCGGGGSVAKG